ncbi:MAG: hypothetical protein JJU12_01420 [Chlamydiales bacterium]|nr:hypothetical protein [Chlamydiales bacterium]
MTCTPSPYFYREGACEHLIKGTAWGAGSIGTTLTIVMIAVGMLILGVASIVWDISFIYKWSIVNSFNLLWGIPVTTLLIALDIGLTWRIGTYSVEAIRGLAGLTKVAVENARTHFRAICLTPANSIL